MEASLALMTSAYNARASRRGDRLQLRALLSTAIFRSGPPTAMQHGELRAPFIQVHAHMYHRFGLLPPDGMSFCSSLFPDSEGGQCSYDSKWLRAPELNQRPARSDS